MKYISLYNTYLSKIISLTKFYSFVAIDFSYLSGYFFISHTVQIVCRLTYPLYPDIYIVV